MVKLGAALVLLGSGGYGADVNLAVPVPVLGEGWRRRASAFGCELEGVNATWSGIEPCHFYGIPLIARPASTLNLSSRLLLQKSQFPSSKALQLAGCATGMSQPLTVIPSKSWRSVWVKAAPSAI